MTTTVNLRPLVDHKVWESCAPYPQTVSGGHVYVPTPARWPVPHLVVYASSTGTYIYDPKQDAWGDLPVGSMGGTGAGACGTFHPFGPSGTASAGTATTMTTTTTAAGDLSSYTVRLTGGTGAGQVRTISSNTVGANTILTVTGGWSVNPDSTSTYIIMSGRFWFLGATGAAVTWKYYDTCSNAWAAKSVTSGPPATFCSGGANDGYAECTAGILASTSLASGTATAGGASTLTNSAKAWTTNQWANSQVRLTGGTGAGQVRTINSNTGTAITVNAAWSVTPDATSTYVIEGNDDWIYIAGNGVVTLFRYALAGLAGLSSDAQATGDTWITLAPTAARSGAPTTASLSLCWVGDATDTRFATENTCLNGQRLYSFRAGGTPTLDYYDIAAHTWVSSITYSRAGAVMTSGSSYIEHLGYIYIHVGAGRFYRYNAPGQTMDPLASLPALWAGFVLGQGRTFLMSYMDGAVELTWLYQFRFQVSDLFRMLLI